MPLTTRLLFEGVLEAKIDPFNRVDIWLNCLIDKIWGTQSPKLAPFENHKGCGTQSQNQKQIKIIGPDH
jgi:hypothetical protein